MDIARRCAFKLLTVKERCGEFRLLLTSVGDFAVQLSNGRSVVWKAFGIGVQPAQGNDSCVHREAVDFRSAYNKYYSFTQDACRCREFRVARN